LLIQVFQFFIFSRISTVLCGCIEFEWMKDYNIVNFLLWTFVSKGFWY
jgi:hypothetical protein